MTIPDLGPVRFEERRDAGGVLTGTFAVLRAGARPLLAAYLAIVAPVALAGGLAVTMFFRSMAPMMDPSRPPNPEDLSAMFGSSYLGTILFGLLTTSTLMALTGAFVRQFREGVAPEDMTVGGLWDDTRSLILPSLGLQLAFGLVAMLSVLVAIIPCLGILAWIVGLFWALPYIAVTYAVRMLEGGRLASAFERSRELIRGRWGLAGGGMLLTGLVMFLISSALSIPFYLIAFAVGINGLTDPVAMFEMMGWMVGPLQVLSSVTYLVPMVAAFVVHGALVGQGEGGGLWAEVDRLAGEPADDLAAGDDLAASDSLRAAGDPGSPGSAPGSSAPATPDDEPAAPDDAPPGGFRGGGYAP